jgi:hypothetical protein
VQPAELLLWASLSFFLIDPLDQPLQVLHLNRFRRSEEVGS